jgi:hypothetical protein
MASLNLALRFILELCGIAALIVANTALLMVLGGQRRFIPHADRAPHPSRRA